MKKRPQLGFTILEIIIAVMILAASLTTLLSLQTSAMSQALRTRNALEAMLASRAIMAGVEFAADELNEQKREGTVVDVARFFLKEEALAPLIAKQSSVPLNAALIIEPWNLPKLEENTLLRLTLEVSWSPAPQDKIVTYYFLNKPKM